MNQNRNESRKEQRESIWIKVWNRWKIFLGILAAPLIIIPLIFCVLSLYCAAYEVTGKPFSLVLNVIAVVLAGVASGGIWDSVKNMMGNTLLIKKGNSAVRNLSLARLKVKNISERANMDASTVEIKNLLGLLEKDVANSLQEWNDILPGVANIEVVYALLDEKENELNTAIQEKEELNKRLAQEKELQAGQKEKLQNEIYKAKKRVSELAQEADRLRTRAVTTSGYSGYAGPAITPESLIGVHDLGIPSRTLTFQKCSKCGKPYVPINALGDKGLCSECNK